MKKQFSVAVLISLVSTVHAAPDNVPLKAIKPLVVNYLDATSCPNDVYESINTKRITKFSDRANKLNGYIVLTHTDASCAGGTGTSGPAIIVLRIAAGRDGIDDKDLSYLKVDAQLSTPVSRLTYASGPLTGIYQESGQLYATGLSHGKDDANCCPSVKSLYKIKLVKKDVAVGQDDLRPMYTWELTPTRK